MLGVIVSLYSPTFEMYLGYFQSATHSSRYRGYASADEIEFFPTKPTP